MNQNRLPKVTILGAGPGDPELLTIKGLKALRTADVVLYDALSNDELLKHAPEESIKIFVGKRAARHTKPQDEINKLMVQYAFQYGHVVRLKGGDAFVFGRGHEEKVFVEEHGIKVGIIPGISSCIALPELQAVPLTRRNFSQSFWVMTATTKEGKLAGDIKLAVHSTATIVILMGMKKLSRIANLYIDQGKWNTPIMIIQNGSLPEEKYVVGNMSNIESLAAKNGMGTPGIIVIGEVVRLHPEVKNEVLMRFAS